MGEQGAQLGLQGEHVGLQGAHRGLHVGPQVGVHEGVQGTQGTQRANMSFPEAALISGGSNRPLTLTNNPA
ncbi:MAG: hypothetical protein A2Z19_05860 [Deltaproteobacteria bacterium RBG_16_54_18]|nr:MAG: hypothetical protein A2Z19_05860 [Deltaproteobacteria bacterium RBG_16_54_18]